MDLIVVNVYGPNFDCPEFYKTLADTAGNHTDGLFLWGGDFNLVRNPNIDRSGGPERRFSAAARALEGAMIRKDLAMSGAHGIWTKGATRTTQLITTYIHVLTTGYLPRL